MFIVDRTKQQHTSRIQGPQLESKELWRQRQWLAYLDQHDYWILLDAYGLQTGPQSTEIF